MKYAILKQIENFLAKFRKISGISRSDDNCVRIEFEPKFTLFFDLNKQDSKIYSNDDFKAIKEYKAPFDTILARRFKSANILHIKVPENNRIIDIFVKQSGSYKETFSHLYLEFTGRFTNAIITDENGLILEALRHYENDFRCIKVGKILTPLAPFNIKEKESAQISDFEAFFRSEFENLEAEKLKNLKKNKILLIDKKIENLNHILSNLENEDDLREKSENLGNLAQVITANLYKLNDFDRELKLRDFSGNLLEISLENPPKIAAKEFFAQAKKLKQKAQNLALERNNLSEKIEFLKNLKNSIFTAQNSAQILVLSPKPNAKQTHENSDNVENFYIENYKISVGKNERGNEMLLQNSKKDDFWFHLKDIPSAHVIVKTNKKALRDDIILFAAQICVNMSVKFSGKFAVDYTKRENVKIKSGASVNYTDFKTIEIDFVREFK